jgi:glycosyltransferase involved in cell wall biosynthesis
MERNAPPAVSVCIRASNRPPEFLREAIASVLGQSFSDLEVVVSDDSGRLGPVAAEFGDHRVRYHANPRPSGSLDNMRRVLGLARAPLLALLDDDDLWLPGFLATVVERFRAEPDVGIVFTGHFLDVRGHRVRRTAPIAPGRHESFLCELLEHWPVTLSSSLMRREVWEHTERDFPLERGTIGDITIWLAAASGGWPFLYVDEPLAVWRQHAGQMTWSNAIPTRNIATFERFRFDDPAAERLRLARLAEARAARAGMELRRGQVRTALRELARVRRTAPGGLGLRGLMAFTGSRTHVMRVAAAHPRLLVRGVPLWRRVRPRVAR